MAGTQRGTLPPRGLPCAHVAMAAAVSDASAAPPPSATQEPPPLVGEPLADGEDPPIVIAEAYLTPATASQELQPSVAAVFVTSAPIEAAPDPGDAPPPPMQPPMQPPGTPPLAASAVPCTGDSDSVRYRVRLRLRVRQRGGAGLNPSPDPNPNPYG